MWYQNSYRRHLLDMHIADWNDGRFLSEFSPQEYYNNLKRANIKSAMIYFQSHVGYCYYPTKVGHMHSAFNDRPNAMKELVDLCHQGGIDVVAYYSLNYNNVECDAHPEWAMVDKKTYEGLEFIGSRYHLCCPNNPGYMEFVHEQIREMLEYADIDGIFFDMPFWNQICHCEQCRRKWGELFEEKIPDKMGEPLWDTFLQIRETWTDAYISGITALCKSIRPDISVEYNYAHAALDTVEIIGSEVINKSNDYAAGDLYRGFLVQSFACKFYYGVTKNQPFEYMTGRCDPGLHCHTVTKSYDKLRLALMMVTAHHGANFVIDAIDPIGTMDSRFYEFLGELYQEVEHYEPWMSTGSMLADVGLMYILEARGMGEPQEYTHYNATVNTAKTLIQNHIPFDILTQATLSAPDAAERLGKHKAVICANPNHLQPAVADALEIYVKNGGVLYFSGVEAPALLERLLGAKAEGCVETKCAYIAPCEGYEAIFEEFDEKYPLPFLYSLPIIQLQDIGSAQDGGSTQDGSGEEKQIPEVLAKMVLPYISEIYPFSSIHSDPPGTPTDHPAVIMKRVGKGTVIWSAADIEGHRGIHYQRILLNLLVAAGVKEYSVSTDASRNTEIVTFASEKEILVSAVYVTDEDVTEIQRPFAISVKCAEPKEVTLLATGEKIDFTYCNGAVCFMTRELNVFDMYRVVLE